MKLKKFQVTNQTMPTAKELEEQIKANSKLLELYSRMKPQNQQKLLEYCTGRKSVPLTYDPFFKKIFDPQVHPERLSRLLSLLIGETVIIQHVLPHESSRILEEGSLLVMDIVVKLMDGSIANVEIQKIAYLFPGERAACYSSDLVMRQYVLVKDQQGNNFTYKDMKKVYTIVLCEEKASIFSSRPEHYIHKSKQKFDTGLKVDLLQEYIFISLDNFKNIKQNEVTEELDAWLHCIASDEPEVIRIICQQYPEFAMIYAEIEEFSRNVEEVLTMFSEALAILDRNTTQYMVEKLQEEVAQTIAEKEEAIAEKDAAIAGNIERDQRIKELEAQLKMFQSDMME